MKEKPIIFKSEMVRAILAGDKTQTRRIINFEKVAKQSGITNGSLFYSKTFDSWAVHDTPNGMALVDCPYGKKGDTIWVRENWKPTAWTDDGIVTPLYRADNRIGDPQYLYSEEKDPDGEKYNEWWIKLGNELTESGCGMDNEDLYIDPSNHLKWRPSIFMPRSMCRTTSPVLDVHVERVNEISEADAMAEGIKAFTKDNVLYKYGLDGWAWHEHLAGKKQLSMQRKAKDAFRVLWDSINTEKGFGWKVNPWVWKIEFKRIEVKE